jgi:hypothetical protein
LRADDPTRDVRAIWVKSDGFHRWTDDEIAQFESRHPVGSKSRLALALLLCAPPSHRKGREGQGAILRARAPGSQNRSPAPHALPVGAEIEA